MSSTAHEIESVEQQLAAARRELESLRAALADRDEERRSLREAAARAEETIRVLTARSAALSAERDRIQTSLTALLSTRKWRAVQLVERVRDVLAPQGTRRARWVWFIADRLLRRPRHLRQGWRAGAQPAATTEAVPDEPPRTPLHDILAQHPQRLGCVVFPPVVDWGWMRQRPQHLAQQFARAGYVVFYCGPQSQTDYIAGFCRVADRLYLCGEIGHLFSLEQPILVISATHHAELVPRFDRPTLVYDWLDDLRVQTSPGRVPADVLARHERLLRQARVVCATSGLLYDEARQSRPDTLLLPNAADFDHFCLRVDPAVPADLQLIQRQGRPIVGYFGALARWFDFDLCYEVARLRPDYEFVLLGPDYDGTLRAHDARRPPNVHWLGEKNYEDLPAYLHYFDVATIPFQLNEITRATSPIKLFEYMAGGKPVVTTSLPECARQPLVLTADEPTGFAARLDEALQRAADPEHRRALREEARASSWAARFADLHARLAPPDVHAWQRVLVAAQHSRGTIVFPRSIDWQVELIQRPHHLAREFARRGYVVIYEGGAGDGPCVGFRAIQPNLYVYRGPDDLLRDLPAPWLWCYCYNFEQVDRFAPDRKVIYDLVDEPAVHGGDPLRIEANHRRAMREARSVVYVSRALQRLLDRRPDALYLPNGVEVERFGDETLPPPDDQPLAQWVQQGRPIAGYYGALARWFDYELLEQVARRRDEWGFVLIGPDYDQSIWEHALRDCPNVAWLGPRAYERLPAYLRVFDVTMIPFRIDAITEAVSPLKLYEFLAAGKPVVTTPLPECAAFSDVHIVRTVEEFSAALDAARAQGQDPAFRQRVRAIARQNAWRQRVEVIEQSVFAGPERKRGAAPGTP